MAHCSDLACTAATLTTVDSAGSVGQYSSVTIGADGLALISYYDETNGDLKVAHCSNVACTAAAPHHGGQRRQRRPIQLCDHREPTVWHSSAITMRRTAISRWLTAPTFFAFPTTAAAEQLSIAESHDEMRSNERGRDSVVEV